jgi:hypothetical protein
MASKPFVVNNTGVVVGGYTKQPASIRIRGWALSNSAASVGSVGLWVPNSVPNGDPVLPGNGAGNSLLFTIQVLANSSKEFVFDEDVYFTDGLFAIASASTVTGVLFIA